MCSAEREMSYTRLPRLLVLEINKVIVDSALSHFGNHRVNYNQGP